MLADDAAPRAHSLRRAMLQPDRYLAAALAEWPDDHLADAMQADPGKIRRLRLSGPPRPSHWHRDTRRLAALVDADPGLLRIVLRLLGVQP